MTASGNNSGTDSDFFIPLAPGETREDRLAEIRADELSRHTVDPAHANVRGYVWNYELAGSGPLYPQGHRFQIIAANGREYMAVSDAADTAGLKELYKPGAMVKFSANNRGIILETHMASLPDSARIVDYDLGQRAWVAEDKVQNRRFSFTTRPGGEYVHSFHGSPSLGAQISYHADKYGEPYGVMVQKVPRPVEAWRSTAFQVKRVGLVPLLFLSAGLQAMGAEKLASALLGGNKPVKPLPAVKFPPLSL